MGIDRLVMFLTNNVRSPYPHPITCPPALTSSRAHPKSSE